MIDGFSDVHKDDIDTEVRIVKKKPNRKERDQK